MARKTTKKGGGTVGIMAHALMEYLIEIPLNGMMLLNFL